MPSDGTTVAPDAVSLSYKQWTSLAYKNHSDPVFADPVFGGFSFILHLKHDGIDEGIHDLRKIFKKGDKDEDPFEKYSWMKTFFYNILRNNAPAKPKGMDLSKDLKRITEEDAAKIANYLVFNLKRSKWSKSPSQLLSSLRSECPAINTVASEEPFFRPTVVTILKILKNGFLAKIMILPMVIFIGLAFIFILLPLVHTDGHTSLGQ